MTEESPRRRRLVELADRLEREERARQAEHDAILRRIVAFAAMVDRQYAAQQRRAELPPEVTLREWAYRCPPDVREQVAADLGVDLRERQAA